MSSATNIERILLDRDPQLLVDAERVLEDEVGANARGGPPVKSHQMMGLVCVANAAAETNRPADGLKYADHQSKKLDPASDRDRPMYAFWSAFKKALKGIQESSTEDMAGHGKEDVNRLHAAMILAFTRHLAAHNRYLGAAPAGRRQRNGP